MIPSFIFIPPTTLLVFVARREVKWIEKTLNCPSNPRPLIRAFSHDVFHAAGQGAHGQGTGRVTGHGVRGLRATNQGAPASSPAREGGDRRRGVLVDGERGHEFYLGVSAPFLFLYFFKKYFL